MLTPPVNSRSARRIRDRRVIGALSLLIAAYLVPYAVLALDTHQEVVRATKVELPTGSLEYKFERIVAGKAINFSIQSKHDFDPERLVVYYCPEFATICEIEPKRAGLIAITGVTFLTLVNGPLFLLSKLGQRE